MAGGIRYLVCCDDCGVDAMPREDHSGEYHTEQTAMAVRAWATSTAGWTLQHPNTENQWLSCPDCVKLHKKMSVPHLTVVGNK